MNIESVKSWLADSNNIEYTMMAIGYDPGNKKNVFKYGFELNNTISDRDYFAQILSKILLAEVGDRYIAEFENPDANWHPQDFSIDPEDKKRIMEFIQLIIWKGVNHVGEIEVVDIFSLFITYLDFPQKYNYSPIFIKSLDKDVVIVISDHGNVWIVSEDKDLLDGIADLADASGATVVFSS